MTTLYGLGRGPIWTKMVYGKHAWGVVINISIYQEYPTIYSVKTLFFYNIYLAGKFTEQNRYVILKYFFFKTNYDWNTTRWWSERNKHTTFRYTSVKALFFVFSIIFIIVNSLYFLLSSFPGNDFRAFLAGKLRIKLFHNAKYFPPFEYIGICFRMM